jgi:hypothetical protein
VFRFRVSSGFLVPHLGATLGSCPALLPHPQSWLTRLSPGGPHVIMLGIVFAAQYPEGGTPGRAGPHV